MRNPRINIKPVVGIVVSAIAIALCCVAIAADLSTEPQSAAVNAEQYADFMSVEVLDLENLADFVEGQRQYFNRITPPGISWVQPMFPSVAPFDASYFSESFLDGLLGEEKYSVAVYPLSFALDPKTRETLVYNAEGKLISVFTSVKSAWTTTKGEDDPARVTLQLDLLPVEDVEPYLYVEGRISETASSAAAKSVKGGSVTMKSLGVTEFGIADIQTQSNGAMRITATNGTGTAEVFSFTVWHTNTVDVVPDTNGIPVTNIIWWVASATFNGVDEAWDCRTTNLVFTNGIAVWDDTDIPTNARQRMYSVALRTDTDEDGLTDGSEFFIYHSNPGTNDTDGDAMLDGWEVLYGFNPLSDDSLDDPDNDGLPNVYEQFHDSDPTNSDAASVTILRVDPAASGSNVYANLDAAFDASEAYSIIEVADGIYSGSSNTHLWFPAHPIMLRSDNGGTSRQTAFTYNGEWAAFYLDAEQNSHTIIRGISVRLGGQWSQQYGFWLGPGIYYGQDGAAPFFDGVSVEMGESQVNVAYFCRGATPGPVIFNNCVFRGKPGKSVPLRGIYAMDSSSIEIINCSFLGFPSSPYAYGFQLHSLYLAETGLVEIANSLWDSTFTASNPTPPFVKSLQYTNSVPYLVHIADSIMPAVPTWYTPDAQTNLYITNALVAMAGHLQTNSPGIDDGGLALTRYDFEGQARDASPDIGADEYAALGESDSDGDGLSNSSEVETYGSDPYRADSDSDGIADGIEASDGTDPADPWSYRFIVQGTATNQTGSSSPIWLCRRWGAGAWDTNTASIVTNGNYEFSVLASNQPYALCLGSFCDFNTNGSPDSIEPIYWKTIAVTGFITRTNFLLKDFDGDLAEDWHEVQCGSDPMSTSNYCVSIYGCLTNLFVASGRYYVGMALTTNVNDILALTDVSSNASYEMSCVQMNNTNRIVYIHHFDDVNTNGICDTNELYGFRYLARTGAIHRVILNPLDNDSDGMPDFWEERIGMSYTNKYDAAEDADGDDVYNIHEYWFGSDPWISDNTSTGTAVREATSSVDSQLVGRTPSVALPIFTIQNHAATNYVRNTNCWAYSYNLTCNSPWNSTYGVYYSATLISPRHVLFAAHWDYVTNGTVMRFVDQQNNVIERTISAKVRHPLYSPYYPDLSVGLLNSDVPTNQISFAKVMPDDYCDYLHTGNRLPALWLNQWRRAQVGDVINIVNVNPSNEKHCTLTEPQDATRHLYYQNPLGELGPTGGDSGNPVFLLLSGEPILLTVWTHGYPSDSGTAISSFKQDINNLMQELGGGYQLTEYDMSGFRKIRD